MRPSAPTRFPKLPQLSPKDLAKLPPAALAQYQAELAHQDAWGHLPPQLSKHLRGLKPENLSPLAVENHAREKKLDPVHFAAAKAYHKWAVGQELSPEDFDAAVEKVLNETHGL